MNEPPQLGGFLKESFFSFGKAGQEIVESCQVCRAGGFMRDEDRPGPKCRVPLAWVGVDQSNDFPRAGYGIALRVLHKNSIEAWKGEKTEIVPSQGVKSVELRLLSLEQHKSVGRQIVEAKVGTEIPNPPAETQAKAEVMISEIFEKSKIESDGGAEDNTKCACSEASEKASEEETSRETYGDTRGEIPYDVFKNFGEI